MNKVIILTSISLLVLTACQTGTSTLEPISDYESIKPLEKIQDTEAEVIVEESATIPPAVQTESTNSEESTLNESVAPVSSNTSSFVDESGAPIPEEEKQEIVENLINAQSSRCDDLEGLEKDFCLRTVSDLQKELN